MLATLQHKQEFSLIQVVDIITVVSWESFDDTYIQGNNSATDFSIKAEVENERRLGINTCGPDIDDIELNITTQ